MSGAVAEIHRHSLQPWHDSTPIHSLLISSCRLHSEWSQLDSNLDLASPEASTQLVSQQVGVELTPENRRVSTCLTTWLKFAVKFAVGWQLDRDLDLAPPVHVLPWVFVPALVFLRPRRQGGFDALQPARLCQILDGLVLIRAHCVSVGADTSARDMGQSTQPRVSNAICSI